MDQSQPPNTLARVASSTLLGAGEALREALGVPPLPGFMFDLQATIAVARPYIDGTTWERAWSDGQAMQVEQAFAYALADATSQEAGSRRD